MRVRAVILAAALMLAPLGARAADLVVWWEEGFYPEEDEAVRGDDRRVRAEDRQDRSSSSFIPQDELPAKLQAALEAGRTARLRVRPATTDLLPAVGAGGPARRAVSGPRPAHRAVRHGRPGPRHAAQRAHRAQRGLYALPMGRYTQPRPRLEEPARAAPASRSPTSPRSGSRSGPSGATRFSRPSARRYSTGNTCTLAQAAEGEDAGEYEKRRRGQDEHPAEGRDDPAQHVIGDRGDTVAVEHSPQDECQGYRGGRAEDPGVDPGLPRLAAASLARRAVGRS